MTNHISREQAEEIAREAGNYQSIPGVSEWHLGPKQLTKVLNLAIDKVIGEPVAWIYWYPSGQSWVSATNPKNHDEKSLSEAEISVEPLYALKEVKP